MKKDRQQASKYLGKKVKYSSHYDPSLLVRVERVVDRERIGYESKKPLPFVGFDIWNLYEVSFLTKKGMPVSCIGKMVYSCSSKYIVESKSLKLYLNSLNNTIMGESIRDCICNAEKLIKKDISKLLGTDVAVRMFFSNEDAQEFFINYTKLEELSYMEKVEFDIYKEDRRLLKVKEELSIPAPQKYCSSLLKSNCKVTSQPDWGDVFVYINSRLIVDPISLLQYIVSFRDENHFHEEVCEAIYYSLYHQFLPKDLLVACRYTRRGGIDICPIRYNNKGLVDNHYIAYDSPYRRTTRQ